MNGKTIKPAIVVVGYNRPESLERLLLSIERADYPSNDIDLIVSIDKSKYQNEVVQAVDHVEWTHGKKLVRTFDERQGLRKHIIQCGDLSYKYKAVIILEDDLIISPSFYHYTYRAVNHYYKDDNVCGISLYRHSWNGYAELPFIPCKNEYDTFCGQFSITWGQCWTDKQWDAFKKWYLNNEDSFPDSNERLPSSVMRWGKQSWGKYFVSYIVEANKYYIIPYIAMSTNFSEVGQHNYQVDVSHQVPILEGVKYDYEFPDFKDSVKYDVFFERVFDYATDIGGVMASEICVNLNGTKPSTLGKKYVLSTKNLGSMSLASFGMAMRPIDSNITIGTVGKGIYLYETDSSDLEVNIKDPGKARRNYELYHFYWAILLKEGYRRFCSVIKNRLRKGITK